MKLASYAFAVVLSLAGSAAMAGYADMQKLYMQPDLKAATSDDILEFGDQTLATGICYSRDNTAVVTGLAAQYVGDGLRMEIVTGSADRSLFYKTFADLKSDLEPRLASKELVSAKVQDGALTMLRAGGKSMISVKMMGVYLMVAAGDPAKVATSADRYCYFHKNLREARQMKALTSKRFYDMAQSIFDDKAVSPADLNFVTSQPGVNVTHGLCASGTSTASIPAIGALLTQNDFKGGIIAADFGFYTAENYTHDEYLKTIEENGEFSKDRIMVNYSRMFGDFFASASSVQKDDKFTSSASAKNNIRFRYRQYGPYIISSMMPLKDSTDLNPDKGTVCVFFAEPDVEKRDAISIDSQKNWPEQDKDFFYRKKFQFILAPGDVIRIKAKPADDKNIPKGAVLFHLEQQKLLTWNTLVITELQEGTIPWSADDNKAGFKILKMTPNLYVWHDHPETPGDCFRDKQPRKSESPFKIDVLNDNARLSFKLFNIAQWDQNGRCLFFDAPSVGQLFEVFDVEFTLGDRAFASPAFIGW